MSKVRLLFICDMGVNRSFVAANIYKEQGYDTDSVGLYNFVGKEGKEKIQEKIDWADIVFVMSSKHDETLRAFYYVAQKPIIILNIPDKYSLGNQIHKDKLVKKLLQRVAPILSLPTKLLMNSMREWTEYEVTDKDAIVHLTVYGADGDLLDNYAVFEREMSGVATALNDIPPDRWSVLMNRKRVLPVIVKNLRVDWKQDGEKGPFRRVQPIRGE